MSGKRRNDRDAIKRRGGWITDWKRARGDFAKEVTTGRRGDLLEYSRSIRSNIKLASKYPRADLTYGISGILIIVLLAGAFINWIHQFMLSR